MNWATVLLRPNRELQTVRQNQQPNGGNGVPLGEHYGNPSDAITWVWHAGGAGRAGCTDSRFQAPDDLIISKPLIHHR